MLYCSAKRRANALLHLELSGQLPARDPFKDYSGLNNTSTTTGGGGSATQGDRVSVLEQTNVYTSNMQNATLSQRSAESQEGK